MEVWVGTYLRNGVNAFFADYALAEFTADRFKAVLARDDEHIIVSDNENGIDGFIRVSLDVPAPVSGCSSTEIKTLYVQPRHHGAGIGRGLLKEALGKCAALGIDAVWLAVNSENTSALGFYEALGFRKRGQKHFRVAGEAYLNEVMTLKHVSIFRIRATCFKLLFLCTPLTENRFPLFRDMHERLPDETGNGPPVGSPCQSVTDVRIRPPRPSPP